MVFEYKIISVDSGYEAGTRGTVKPGNRQQLQDMFDYFGQEGYEYTGEVGDPGHTGLLLVFRRTKDG